MNTSRTFLLLLAAIVILLLLISILRLAGKPFQKIVEIPYKESNTFAVWLAGIVAMLIAAFLPAAWVIQETADLIYGSATGPNMQGPKSIFPTALTTTSILLLLAAVWFWVWQLIGTFLIILIIGKKNVLVEMELDNTTYFITRNFLILLGMIVLLPFYFSILRYFLPSITLPFYR